jgi:hypothetical protein
MRDTLKINFFNISEVSKTPLIINGKPEKKITYTEALKLNLIEGNKDGWRLPTIKEWHFLMWLEPLEIISFNENYYLTSETGPEYIPEKIRNSDLEIQNNIKQNSFYLQGSGISSTYIWDNSENEAWEESYDGYYYHYVLVRDLKYKK